MALKWQALGAHRLHIVDLDGARSGKPENMDIIRQISHTLFIPTQVGGGIRNLETIEALLRADVDRVILGTAAIENPAFAEAACRRFNEAVIIGIDARDGQVATHGWEKDTDTNFIKFAREMRKRGAYRFIFTDIRRDGTMTEPNFSSTLELIEAARLPVVASGGISSFTQLRIMKMLGAEGAIIGKALYTGDLDLKHIVNNI